MSENDRVSRTRALEHKSVIQEYSSMVSQMKLVDEDLEIVTHEGQLYMVRFTAQGWQVSLGLILDDSRYIANT